MQAYCCGVTSPSSPLLWKLNAAADSSLPPGGSVEVGISVLPCMTIPPGTLAADLLACLLDCFLSSLATLPKSSMTSSEELKEFLFKGAVNSFRRQMTTLSPHVAQADVIKSINNVHVVTGGNAKNVSIVPVTESLRFFLCIWCLASMNMYTIIQVNLIFIAPFMQE